jgi:hypothetical protein
MRSSSTPTHNSVLAVNDSAHRTLSRLQTEEVLLLRREAPTPREDRRDGVRVMGGVPLVCVDAQPRWCSMDGVRGWWS